MRKKWKQTGAALLIAGLTVTGTSYAWADEKEKNPIDLSQLGKESSNEVVEDSTKNIEKPKVESAVKVDKVKKEVKEVGSKEAEESVLPETPEGYTAGNLDALAKAYEKVQNPTAKASIKRNMDRSLEKWENKQSETVTGEQPEVIKESVKLVTPVTPVKQEKPAKVEQKKAPQAELNAEHKEQRQELKAEQKAEREDLKTERKADKEMEKEKKN